MSSQTSWKNVYGALLIAVIVGLITVGILDALDVPVGRGRDASALYSPLLVAAGVLIAGYSWERNRDRKTPSQ